MIDKIVEIDKQVMVFLNKTISNPIFDIIMPIITNQNFLVFSGLILVGYLAYYGGKRGRITIAVLLIAGDQFPVIGVVFVELFGNAGIVDPEQ